MKSKKTINNIAWLFVDKMNRMLVGVLIGVWIARYLGPEQFGLLNYATAFVSMFSALATVGLQSIVVREVIRYPADVNEILGSAGLIQILGGLVAFGLVVIAINYTRPDDATAKLYTTILGAMMLFKATDISIYWFESQLSSKYIVMIQNIAMLFSGVVKAFLIYNDAPLLYFVCTITGEFVLAGLFGLILMGRYGPRIINLKFSLPWCLQLVKCSWPLICSALAVTLYMKIDQIMLGQMVGNKAVGMYSVAVRISEFWYFIPTIIVSSLSPAIFGMLNKDRVENINLLQRLFDIMSLLSIGISVPLAFLATPLIILIFGEGYHEAGNILSVHIWGSVFVFFGLASRHWLVAENLQILNLEKTITGAVINIVLNLWLIPIYEGLGAAVATVISYAYAAFISDAINKKTRKIFVMKCKSLNLISSLKRVVSC